MQTFFKKIISKALNSTILIHLKEPYLHISKNWKGKKKKKIKAWLHLPRDSWTEVQVCADNSIFARN